jgi:hypothetical protein
MKAELLRINKMITKLKFYLLSIYVRLLGDKIQSVLPWVAWSWRLCPDLLEILRIKIEQRGRHAAIDPGPFLKNIFMRWKMECSILRGEAEVKLNSSF